MNVPNYNVENLSFGPGVIYLGSVGSTPTSDVGAVDLGMELEHETDILEFVQGSPNRVVMELREEERVSFTFSGLEWRLENFDKYLGAGTFEEDTFEYGGDLSVIEASLRLVHQFPPRIGETVGSTVTIDVWKVRSEGDMDLVFEMSVHNFDVLFDAMEVEEDWAGNSLEAGERFYRLALETYIAPEPRVITIDNFEYTTDLNAENSWISSGGLFSLQCREQATYGTNPGATWGVVSSTLATLTGAALRGRSLVFAVFDKGFLEGKKLRLKNYSSREYDALNHYARIYDGEYNRTSDTDFPDGTGFPTKGAGLLQTIHEWTAPAGAVTKDTTVVVDLSSSTEDFVTVMIWGDDSSNSRAINFRVQNFEIKDPVTENIITTADVDHAVTNERTGTIHDYSIQGHDSLDLQAYSESAIKMQDSYSLKVVATQDDSLNETLTKTFNPSLDLSGFKLIRFWVRASRTGTNFKLGIHDTGGTTSEYDVVINDSNTWEQKTWDLSEVSDANKDAIDQVILTITNADSQNTIYLDNMLAIERES